MSGEDDNKITFMWLGDPVTIISKFISCFNIRNNYVTLVGILIFNLFIYKCMDVRHKSLTIATKFVIGMCFSIATMCIAGTVEVFRQEGCDINCNIREW
jgi:hypothetical protein